MTRWSVERIVHFRRGEFVRGGFAHFGFHDDRGRLLAVGHQQHCIGLIGDGGDVEWTIGARPVFPGVANIRTRLRFPMYVDVLPDATLVVSNFGNARLYRVDTARMTSELLVDGRALGMADMGNCVVDGEGCIWVNEVRGCRVWRFDAAGNTVLVLGNGSPGFQREDVAFEDARFSWIYDLRRGPDGAIYVLDSKNFALRMIEVQEGCVRTLAGNGTAGYGGDGGAAGSASFGGDPAAKFEGPISLAIDEAGNAYIGDRFNHVVRMIEAEAGIITTIAGRLDADVERANDPFELDPLRINLPQISSMDYYGERLFVPTDLGDGSGDLIVLRKA